MNDRYLYRAKRMDNGEWIVGNRIDDGVTGQVFIHAAGNTVNESDKVGEDGYLRFVAFEVDPSTICQCTGLKDKNGKLIWEGLSRSCEYAGTQEMVHETFLEALEELGGVGDWDEMAAEDLEGQMCVLQSLFEEFYDRIIEKVLNFIETEE